MADNEKKMWFAPKTFGYGVGLPIRWEGWALLAGFIAAVVGVGIFAHFYFAGSERGFAHAVGVCVLLIPFVLIARARTEGGWRWRNGDE